MMPRAKKLRFLFAALALLAGSPVQAADRVPDDTYYEEQWYLRHIGAPEAWNKSLGLETVSIAFIDSGVDIDHPDLKDNVWRNPGEIANNGIDDDRNGYVDDVHGWDFVGRDADPRPDLTGDYTVLGANHGTVNAGVATARGDNARGITGVTWQSTIMPLRALDSSGFGEGPTVARAVEYAVANGAKVINLSFVRTGFSRELQTALRRAYDAGVFIVAAAGNAPDGGVATDLDKKRLYPVCLDLGADENFIYGVAATDEQDRKAEFSNYGAGCIDGSAPGVRILSTQLYRPGTKYFDSAYGGFYNGTSVAAPIVSGTVALIRAVDPRLTPKQITNILTESSFKIDDLNPELFGKLGRGRIDAARAVDLALGVRPAVASQAPPTPTAALLPPGGSGRVVVAAPGAGRAPEIRMYTEDGTYVRSFLAFSESFQGGVSLALGNFDATRRRTIVTGAGPGAAPQVRVFDIDTLLIGEFLAYDVAFRGGVHVVAADLDGDGRDEIITGAGPGGGPHVRIFGLDGAPKGGFFAFDPARRHGVHVAVADIDGDGRVEIIASEPGVALARAYDIRGRLVAELPSFVAARPGVLGALPGSAPTVDVFGRVALTFFAYEPKFRGGVSAVLTD